MYKCINKKDSFKNLTLNKDYEGEEVGNFIEVTNDSNVKARYDKKYFELIIPRPRIRTITCQQFVDEFFRFNINSENNVHGIQITYNNEHIRYLYFNSTINTCGVKFIDGMLELKSFIEHEILNNIPSNVILSDNEENNSKLFYTIIRQVIIEFERQTNSSYAFYMFTTYNANDSIYQILDQHAIKTESEVNPNSGNEIAVWICSRTQLGI